MHTIRIGITLCELTLSLFFTDPIGLHNNAYKRHAHKKFCELVLETTPKENYGLRMYKLCISGFTKSIKKKIALVAQASKV